MAPPQEHIVIKNENPYICSIVGLFAFVFFIYSFLMPRYIKMNFPYEDDAFTVTGDSALNTFMTFQVAFADMLFESARLLVFFSPIIFLVGMAAYVFFAFRALVEELIN